MMPGRLAPSGRKPLESQDPRRSPGRIPSAPLTATSPRGALDRPRRRTPPRQSRRRGGSPLRDPADAARARNASRRCRRPMLAARRPPAAARADRRNCGRRWQSAAASASTTRDHRGPAGTRQREGVVPVALRPRARLTPQSERSVLGRKVAVDLETDADLDQLRSMPAHGGLLRCFLVLPRRTTRQSKRTTIPPSIGRGSTDFKTASQ